MAAEPLPLSVAIITRNEEARLPDCLASVAFASEVVVVDSGSSDRTVEIANRFGARVHSEPWRGFGRQKQLAIERCTQPWVLVLDADERVSLELAAELRALFAASPTASAWSMPRKNYFCGHWLRHAGWWPDRVVRLFRRGKARMNDRLVHEALEVDGPVAELAGPLLHLTNRDLAHTLAKINQYSSAGAEELARRGERGSVGKALARAAWAFLHGYILRLGLLDGAAGLAQALAHAVNTLFKYLKLWERQQRGNGGRREKA
ncbi:MAG: glycosyltransferase family 2 protein [Thermodesulfobacteriota bacterium]